MSTLHDEGIVSANCKYLNSTDMTKLKFQKRRLNPIYRFHIFIYYYTLPIVEGDSLIIYTN